MTFQAANAVREHHTEEVNLPPLRQGHIGPRTSGALQEGERARVTLRRDAAYRRSLALADLASAAFAMLIATVVLGEDSLRATAIAAAPAIVLVGKVLGLYDRDEHLVSKSTLDEVPKLFHVATLYTLVVWLLDGAVVEGYLGRGQVVGLWVLLFCGMVFGRVLARSTVRGVVREERILVIGSDSSAERVGRKFANAPGVKATVVGRVPLQQDDDRSAGLQIDQRDREVVVLGSIWQLDDLLSINAIDRVIVAPDLSDPNRVLDVIRLVKSLGVKVSVLPRLFEAVGSSAMYDEVDGMTLLGIRRFGLTRSSAALKRGMDIAGAGLGLILLAPVFAFIALAIKLDSPGPVLFRQRRVGRDDQEFEMLKFRTMVDGADRQKSDLRGLNEADGLFKIADDPRMTRLGRALRRASFDELPQLINVLRGEMSLVGPRPLVADDDRRVHGWDRRRLDVRPGMTGAWQVAGSARVPLAEMVKIDYLYAANWSLWRDVKVLFRTVPHVVARRGI